MPNPRRFGGGGGGLVQLVGEPSRFSPNPTAPQNSVAVELIDDAIGLAGFQSMLQAIPEPDVRKQTIMRWFQRRWITGSQAEMLIAHNGLKAA